VSFSFPSVKRSTLGYKPEQVDAFIAKAREQYARSDIDLLAATDLRHAEFQLVKGGYSISAVDVAIDRLEDAFATRELERRKARVGDWALTRRADELRELLVGRTDRPKGKRFSRTGLVLRGYSRRQVDAFINVVAEHLVSGEALSLDYVRRIVFKAKRGGYAENQVDAFIERVVELLQIERVS